MGVNLRRYRMKTGLGVAAIFVLYAFFFWGMPLAMFGKKQGIILAMLFHLLFALCAVAAWAFSG